MNFADSTMNTRRSREDNLMNLDVKVCKNQRRVCFIRGEEFQRVGRTIFIRYKMLLFAYIFIISTRIFKILTFFYQVIILLIKTKVVPRYSSLLIHGSIHKIVILRGLNVLIQKQLLCTLYTV